MLHLQKTILEMIARGDPLPASMQRLCEELARELGAAGCSLDLSDTSGCLTPLSIAIGETENASAIGKDFDHAAVQTIALKRAKVCAGQHVDTSARHRVTTPVVDKTGRATGALSLHFDWRRNLSPSDLQTLDEMARLSVLALDREREFVSHERRANEDALTGLPNRAAFDARLASLSCSVPGAWALLAIDLDNLKPVNDTFGHHVGDMLLKVSAERLATATHPAAVFRIGGDEFILVIENKDDLQDLDAFASCILRELEKPTDCAGIRVSPKASMGYAVLSADDAGAETVRQNADHALYCAKETKRGGVIRYWPGLGSPITDRIRQIREIESALHSDRVEAWYQPIVFLQSERITGLEAFCRIRTRTGAIRSAAEFDLGVSDAHVAYELTRRMLAIVAADMHDRFDDRCTLDFVAINISSADLRVPGLVDEVLGILAGSQVSPERLVLDLNETTHLALRDHHALEVIGQLRRTGIRIALDDFGSGIASLSHLMSVPVDIIKLDPSLTRATGMRDKAEAIISGMLDISRRLDLAVIAEAVETEEQFRWLRALGCPHGQGYRFAPPLCCGELSDLLGHDASSLPAHQSVVAAR